MNARLWQRQPGEEPADFTAFVTYLRLKGRRSHRAVAARTGRSPRVIGRLSVRFNWPGRVAAFETRLADAAANALEEQVRATAARTQAEIEQLRVDEFDLAQRVLRESKRWLKVAVDPRRRDVSLGQVCRMSELASKLARQAIGIPVDGKPRRRTREDAPGFWTNPSVEEALEKIYGQPDRRDEFHESPTPFVGNPSSLVTHHSPESSTPSSAQPETRNAKPPPSNSDSLVPVIPAPERRSPDRLGETVSTQPGVVVVPASPLGPDPPNASTTGVAATESVARPPPSPPSTYVEPPVTEPRRVRRDAWASAARILTSLRRPGMR